MMPLGHLGLPLMPFLGRRAYKVDPRLLMLGGILPDLIDKPLGHLVLTMNNGRIFAHTLLFAVVLLSAGIVFRKLLPLSLGVSFHHLFDNLYLEPRSTLWPLMGPFQASDFHFSSWLTAFTDPQVFGWELLGILVIMVYLVQKGIRTPRDLFCFAIKGSYPQKIVKGGSRGTDPKRH
ncbi:MAG: metal-dependent hydrolase [Candidatus Thermoplasmatota archaeon]|nr:metal-dependent hydrolase [Candidatus Thermoplasmatota archaeon]